MPVSLIRYNFHLINFPIFENPIYILTIKYIVFTEKWPKKKPSNIFVLFDLTYNFQIVIQQMLDLFLHSIILCFWFNLFRMSGVEVIIEDLSTHPSCVHGPTLLFSRDIDGHKRYYYACSACRDRKKCSFFVWKDELEKYVNKKINKQILDHNKVINHRSLFLQLNKVKLEEKLNLRSSNSYFSGESSSRG